MRKKLRDGLWLVLALSLRAGAQQVTISQPIQYHAFDRAQPLQAWRCSAPQLALGTHQVDFLNTAGAVVGYVDCAGVIHGAGGSGANTALSNLANLTAINVDTLTFAGAGGLTSASGEDITFFPSTGTLYLNDSTNATSTYFNNTISGGVDTFSIEGDSYAISPASTMVFRDSDDSVNVLQLGDGISNLNWIGTNNNTLDDGIGNATFSSSVSTPTTLTYAVGTGYPGNFDLNGIIVASAGTATYTFLGTYTSSPVCVVQDDTTIAGLLTKTVSTTTLTVTTSGATDSVSYICTFRN